VIQYNTHKYTNNNKANAHVYRHGHRLVDIYSAGEKGSEAKSEEYEVPRMAATFPRCTATAIVMKQHA